MKSRVTNGEFIDIKSTFEYVPFKRIRRITGYLVGSTDRWCNQKYPIVHPVLSWNPHNVG
jgi:hypothetical protein